MNVFRSLWEMGSAMVLAAGFVCCRAMRAFTVWRGLGRCGHSYIILYSFQFTFHSFSTLTGLNIHTASMCVWHYAYCGRRLTCMWPYTFGAGEDWKRTNRNMLLPMAVLSINRAPKGGRRGRSVIRKIDQKKESKHTYTHSHPW